MKKSKRKQEWESNALIELSGLIGKPVPCIKWFDGTRIPQPAVFTTWALYASLLYRIELWQQAGLPASPEITKLLSDTRAHERRAYADWIVFKKKINAQYLSGVRKVRPPWY
jgi:hypothetical protein